MIGYLKLNTITVWGPFVQCIGQVVGIYRQTLIIYLRYVCMNTIRCTRRNCHRTYICSMCRWLRKLIAVLFTAHNCNHMIEFLVWVRIPTNIYIYFIDFLPRRPVNYVSISVIHSEFPIARQSNFKINSLVAPSAHVVFFSLPLSCHSNAQFLRSGKIH